MRWGQFWGGGGGGQVEEPSSESGKGGGQRKHHSGHPLNSFSLGCKERKEGEPLGNRAGSNTRRLPEVTVHVPRWLVGWLVTDHGGGDVVSVTALSWLTV